MKLFAALCGGVSLLAIGTAAFAQDASAPAAQVTPTSPAPVAQSSSLDTVVVTGSRIVRNGYAAPTPVTVAPATELEALTPSTIPDALNKLPEFAGSTGAAAGAVSNGVPGNYLNLRDFGINRTLILMDGLRVAPTNFNGQVDVNAIPQMLLQRVDVVTGGASAVYGSDAVTGVVNFIMDNHFNGLKADVQRGVSNDGDSRSGRYGIAAGSNLLNHGHVEVSFEHFDEDGLNATQRAFSSARNVYTGSGTAASPYTLTSQAGTANTAFGGYVLSGPFAGQQFLANGQLGPYVRGAPTSTPSIVTGGDAVYLNREPLTAPQNENQAFARFDYDFNEHLSAFVQGTDTWTISHQANSNWPQQLLTFYSGNPFLPASAQAQLAPGQSFTANIYPRDLELMSQQTQATAANSVTAGLKGTFADFKWNADYTHGSAIYRESLSNNINVPNFLAAADAVSGPNGPQCYVSTTANASKYPGCSPIDMFGVGNESPAALAFIYKTTSFRVVNYFDDYSASLSGNAFNDWAGPVSVAVNAEYRQQELKETSNANPTVPVTNVTGVLRDIPINGVTNRPSPPAAVYAYATVAPTDASNNVWEVSGETVVPLAKDLPWIKSLDVSGAVRYTDYSSSGSVVTWKAGLDYQPVNDIRFRATESQDIRAPTLYDLYAGQSELVQNLNDVYASKVNQVVFITTRGNPNLVPEKSLTTTAGIVWSPSWLHGFRASVDYYNISMDNAITTLQGNNATLLQQCAAQPTAPLCAQLIVRGNGPNAFPTAVYSEPFNVAKTWTNGVDVEASYNVTLQDLAKALRGDLGVRLLYSYQPTLDSISFKGAPTVNAAGTVGGSTAGAGVATNRVTLMANYALGPFSANWQTRWSSALARGIPGQYFVQGALPAYSSSDLNLNYHLVADGHVLNLFFNIQNLFNAQPRVAPNITFSGIPGFGSSVVTGDDLIGRYFTTGLKFRF